MTEKKFKKIFANRLRWAMNVVGVNQKQLSKCSGVSEANISRYLNEQLMPTFKAVVNINHALNGNLYYYDLLAEAIGN